MSLHGKKAGRKWESLVGYCLEDLVAWLESQFEHGTGPDGEDMSWDNYGRARGQWSLEHIVPKAAFSYESAEDSGFLVCWMLENLRPLWHEANMNKSACVPAVEDVPPAVLAAMRDAGIVIDGLTDQGEVQAE